MEHKYKPFDWTFTSTYQGTLNEHFRSEVTEQTLNKMKLMQRENILFYHDLTLYEDELHDHGISAMSVRIVSCRMYTYILCAQRVPKHCHI